MAASGLPRGQICFFLFLSSHFMGGGVDNIFEISVSISFFWVPEEEGGMVQQ